MLVAEFAQVVVIAIKRNDNSEMWRALALYGSLSLNLGLMISGGYFLGSFLEKHYHWSNFTVTGILVGFILGIYEMFMMIYQAGKRQK